MLLKDLKWTPQGYAQLWDIAKVYLGGKEITIYRNRREPDSYQIGLITLTPYSLIKAWGSPPPYISALEAQCVLYALTREGKDAA
jgi:hypothetical protein